MVKFQLKTKNFLHSAAQKRFFNQQLFSAIACEYADMSRILSFDRDRIWKKNMIDRLPPIKKPKCLDLACGNGDLTELLLKKYPDAHVTALDLVEPMLAQARQRLGDSQRVVFIKQDMLKTRLPTSSFDLIVVGYGLRNAPDLNQAMAEIKRLLKTGGVVAILDFSRWPRRWRSALELKLLRAWCGIWGLIRSGNSDTYGYIADSLRNFPERPRLHRQFEVQNLKINYTKRHFLGILETIIATNLNNEKN